MESNLLHNKYVTSQNTQLIRGICVAINSKEKRISFACDVLLLFFTEEGERGTVLLH